MKITTICAESSLSDRYQTTIPESVRKILGLNKRDKISYSIDSDGKVVISRLEEGENDPLIEKFLNFLAEDIKNNPQNLQGISTDLINHIQFLVSEVEINLDLPLSEEEE